MPSGDTDDLQSLFDSVSDQVAASAAASEAATVGGAAATDEDAVFNRLGHLARNLHDSLRELGYDKSLEADRATRFPTHAQRLTYIAQMTEQAASPRPQCHRHRQAAAGRTGRGQSRCWRSAGTACSPTSCRSMSSRHWRPIRVPFSPLRRRKIAITNAQLNEIMHGAGFPGSDRPGDQARWSRWCRASRHSCCRSLIEAMPEDMKAEAPEGLMNGPVISAAGRTDVVTSQAQVDDLLESLGF